MSRAPFVIPKADTAFTRESAIHDTTIGWRFVNHRMQERYGVDPLGETAENVAAEYGISRTDQDAFALRSQLRAARAQQSGRLAEEIVRVTARRGKELLEITLDEHPRPSTTMEQLAKLRPAFRKGGTVTAGNSSGRQRRCCCHHHCLRKDREGSWSYSPRTPRRLSIIGG
jgi:acetyl-CoA acyltransferase